MADGYRPQSQRVSVWFGWQTELSIQITDQADIARVVHSAPLLALAELGLPGGLCWVWLTLAPFAAAGRASLRGDPRLLSHLAPWLALVVISLWHPLPWFSAGWRSTVLLALLMGVWANAMHPPTPPREPAP